MSKYISSRLASLQAYVPGEQPADMEYIKLNTNESPYPPPPGVINAVSGAEIAKLNLYPNPDGARLVKRLADFYSVKPENVIIGNGSDELLAFAFLAFGDAEHGVCFPDITYGFYPVYAALYDIPARQIPLRDDFTIDIADYRNAGSNIVLANPNAPTGIALPLSDIEEVVESNSGHIVLIDEAYTDFGAESAVPLTGKYENLIVMHTYSKFRSMAGARMAYAIAQAPLIEDLNKIKYSFNSYNVNRLTQIAGEAALDEDDYFREMCRRVVDTREYTAASLRELGFSMTESSANFLFARNPRIQGKMLYAALKERGVLVRHFDKPRISDYLRITIGTREHMDALLSAITDILAERSKS